jgi:hypothetical protein
VSFVTCSPVAIAAGPAMIIELGHCYSDGGIGGAGAMPGDDLSHSRVTSPIARCP